jgi:hypothetical protein
MRQILRAVFHPLTIVWSAVLFYCFTDIRFPAALLVGIIGATLITMLLRRIGRALVRVLFALVVIIVVAEMISNEAVRTGISQFLDDVMYLNGARAIIWALLFTISYVVLRWVRPATQSA